MTYAMTSLPSLLLAVCWACVKLAGGACHNHAADKCRVAAESGEVDKLQQGGVCWDKTYANFTHLCQVTHYDPRADHFCCCVAARQALCCDYQRDNDEFRCRALTDTVYTQPVLSLLAICLLIGGTVTLLAVIGCACWHRVKAKRMLREDEEQAGKVEDPLDYNCHQLQQQHSLLPVSHLSHTTCQSSMSSTRDSLRCQSCVCACGGGGVTNRLQPSAPPLDDEEPFLANHNQVPYKAPPTHAYPAALLAPYDDQAPPPYEEHTPSNFSKTGNS